MDVPGGANLLLIASRAPVSGQTKTRLGARIGMERAALLHRAFLVDLARRFAPLPDDRPRFDLGWSFAPAEADFAAILSGLGCPPSPDARMLPQAGEGWDVRQADALRRGHALGYARTVLIGSDSPQLPRRVAIAAFGALDNHDVVISRVRDGGYCLIGTNGCHDVVTGVRMSVAGVAEAVVDRAQSRGLRVAELEPTFDVDEVEDLALLIGWLAPDGAAAPATWTALRELNLLGVGAVSNRGDPAEERPLSPILVRR
jgi:glycosyltransferase A (GT-A) superfamily protein (DUF2064 family)